MFRDIIAEVWSLRAFSLMPCCVVLSLMASQPVLALGGLNALHGQSRFSDAKDILRLAQSTDSGAEESTIRPGTLDDILKREPEPDILRVPFDPTIYESPTVDLEQCVWPFCRLPGAPSSADRNPSPLLQILQEIIGDDEPRLGGEIGDTGVEISVEPKIPHIEESTIRVEGELDPVEEDQLHESDQRFNECISKYPGNRDPRFARCMRGESIETGDEIMRENDRISLACHLRDSRNSPTNDENWIVYYWLCADDDKAAVQVYCNRFIGISENNWEYFNCRRTLSVDEVASRVFP